MKILHVINSLNTGGAEKLIANSLPLYPKYGVEVDLLLLNSQNTPFLEELKKNFKGNIFYTGINSYYSPLQILSIRKYLKNYDIVHCHLFPVLYWAVLAKITLLNKQIKLVFTEHNTVNKRLNNPLFSQIDKLIYKYYDKITAITPQVKEVLMEKLSLPNYKIEIVYNGIDVEKYNNALAYKKSIFFNENDKILIQVSRFQEQKDQKTLIRSLIHLPKKYKLLLVGDGELKQESEILVEKLDLQERVKFLGVRMDIPELLKTADIVVQSSHWEGFGLTAVEGMAAGKPTIVSDVAGLREIVKDYGLLFEKGNEKHLAKQILSLENNPSYQVIADKCVKRGNDFHLLKMVEQNIDLYKDLS